MTFLGRQSSALRLGFAGVPRPASSLPQMREEQPNFSPPLVIKVPNELTSIKATARDALHSGPRTRYVASQEVV
ncbi:uncharacterized protein ColSpa_10147 [Colletotrichum spaethianum]|uniref:Uncharacterized protein n=1 Tax=Colletotrichum spaethianum TaxID=700344 RepID=A0AA37UKF5_9PEZI|nr:uncharacterized protein ColSpa_10147 [Colletotrichum spaethianum]GKT49966.1 hypothetical protein ColSpa_10147 [Colletotrichum spaethianum]